MISVKGDSGFRDNEEIDEKWWKMMKFHEGFEFVGIDFAYF